MLQKITKYCKRCWFLSNVFEKTLTTWQSTALVETNKLTSTEGKETEVWMFALHVFRTVISSCIQYLKHRITNLPLKKKMPSAAVYSKLMCIITHFNILQSIQPESTQRCIYNSKQNATSYMSQNWHNVLGYGGILCNLFHIEQVMHASLVIISCKCRFKQHWRNLKIRTKWSRIFHHQLHIFFRQVTWPTIIHQMHQPKYVWY